MGTFTLGRNVSLVCAAAIALSACGGMATGPAVSSVQTAHRVLPPPCGFAAVQVWVSQLSSAQVEGYKANGVACPSTIITGASGVCGSMAFAAPFGLATDSTGHLYVADVNNKRVLVFNESNGSCIASLNTMDEPRGVCVSSSGVVGVAERGVGGTGAGMVEFWFPGQTSGSSTGSAMLTTDWFQWCAFDKAGNFEATGTLEPTGAQQIFYLPAVDVNVPNQTLINSGVATGPYWVGMYVQLPCAGANGETLAVLNTSDQIQYFKINPASGAPSPAGAPHSLNGYPTGGSVDQVAPRGCYTKAELYFPDYNDSKVWKAKEYNLNISLFNGSASGAVGVATNPTGQE